MHDPGVYEDPDVFRPERFIQDGKLNLGARDPTSFVFGYGRRHVESDGRHLFSGTWVLTHTASRICPGRYFAEDTLFINVACMLHVFDITPPIGEDGHPVKTEYVQSDTLVSCVFCKPSDSAKGPVDDILQLPRRLSLHRQA